MRSILSKLYPELKRFPISERLRILRETEIIHYDKWMRSWIFFFSCAISFFIYMASCIFFSKWLPYFIYPIPSAAISILIWNLIKSLYFRPLIPKDDNNK